MVEEKNQKDHTTTNTEEESNKENILKIEDVYLTQSDSVFYNPAQQFNRELSLHVISEYIKDKPNPKLFEAMSATGIRSIKYLKELPKLSVHLNDISKEAIKIISQNLSLNDISKERYKITNKNCNDVMNSSPNQFDVIDIDPYGSSVPFISSALTGIKHKGLLCLTFTDLAVLCSKKERCFTKYNSLTVKDPDHNEVAIRIAIQAVEKEALKLDYHIEPVLSVAIDFYLRTFVIVHKRKKIRNNLNMFYKCICGYKKINITKNRHKNRNIKNEKNTNDLIKDDNNPKENILFPLVNKVSNIHNDQDNNKNTLMPSIKCFSCNTQPILCGPFWSTGYNDKELIKNILLNYNVSDRVKGMLLLISSELDTFLSFSIPDICSTLKQNCIPLKSILSALSNLGYNISLTHTSLNTIKSNAPLSLVYNIILNYFYLKNNKDSEQGSKRLEEIKEIFNTNNDVENLLNKNYYRKLALSKQGPLSKK